MGQRKSLSLRGAGATGVMVLLDGIPLSSPGTSVDLSRIPAAITERLEVLRGAASARYGPGALGGVVNLVTRRPTHGLSLTAEATWGNLALRWPQPRPRARCGAAMGWCCCTALGAAATSASSTTSSQPSTATR